MTRLQTRLGKAVRRLRSEAGYSQEAFADLIGVHRTTMSKIERGAMNLSLGVVERVAKGLKMPLSRLIAEAEGEGRRQATSGPDSGA